MKPSLNCSIECIKQLLPNLAASGLWGAGIAALSIPATAVALPALAGLACVGAYIGLSRKCAPKTEGDERRDLAAALAIIRKRTTHTDKELAALGYQVQFSVEDLHRRLTSLDTAINSLSGQLDHLETNLEKDRILFDDLCFFLQVNFDELKPIIEAMPATLAALKKDNEEFRAYLIRMDGKLDHIIAMMTQDQAKLKGENAQLRSELTQTRSENDSLRASSRDALRTLVEAAEQGDVLATKAIADYERDRDVEAFKRFFDRFTRAGDDIADQAIEEAERATQLAVRAIEEACDRHRQRAALMYTIGDIDRAFESLQVVLRHRKDDRDAINRLGHIHKLRGDLPAAENQYLRLLELAPGQTAAEESWQAAAYGNLGLILRTRGDLVGAEAMLRKALAINEKLGRLNGMANAFGNLGNILQTRGDLDGAEAMYRKALTIEEKLGRLEGMANAFGNLGLILQTRGDLDGAEALYRKSLAIEEKLGRLKGMANAYTNLGNILLTRGDLDGAEAMHHKSLAIDEKLGRLEGMAISYSNLGNILETRGDLDGAEAMYRKALAIDEKLGRLEGEANAYGNLGNILQTRGDLDGADAMYRQALAIDEKLGLLEGMAINSANLGLITARRRDFAEARRLWTLSRDLFAKLGAKPKAVQLQGWLDELAAQ